MLAVHLAQQRRVEVSRDMEAFDRLPIADPVRRELLGQKVQKASLRYHFAQSYPRTMLAAVKWRCIQLALLVGLLVLIVQSVRLPLLTAVERSVSAVGALATAVLIVWLLSEWIGKRVRRRGHALVVLILLVALPIGSVLLTWSHIGIPHSAVTSGALFGWNMGMVALVILMVWVTVETQWQNRLADRHCEHYDGLALSTLRLAGRIAHGRDDWRSSRMAREWCNEVEALAARTELRVSVHERVPLQALRLRALMRSEALRVAEVFRAHRVPILRAYAPEHLDPVAASLVCAVEALLAGDVPALLTSAPEHVARSRIVRDAVVRRIPSAILIAAAIWLPGLVGLTGSAAHSLSVLLGATGAVTLVSPQAANQLNEALGKMLPSK